MLKKLKAAVKGEKKKKSKYEKSTSSGTGINVPSEVKKERCDADPRLSSSAQSNENSQHSGNDDLLERNKRRRATHNSDDGGVEEQDQDSLSFNRSPQFDSIFLDDSKQKKGYLTALKKRLTFSNPPKNSDTDTFLCELSAQFDAKMNLLDDVTIADGDVRERGFGEKWSYFTKEENEAMLTEAANHNLLNMVITSHDASDVTADIKGNFHHDATSGVISWDDSVLSKQVHEPNHDDVAIFPIQLEAASVAGMPTATDRQFRDEAKDRDEQQVRRRRRRNPAANQMKSENFPETTCRVDDRRISDPLLSFQPDQNVEVVYDIPKPIATSQPRRAHVNIEKRTRRSRANRRHEKRNSTELRMQVCPEVETHNNVKLRSSSPVEQGSFFDRARKKNFRVSGVSIAMEDVFSRAEEDLHNNSFEPKAPPPPPVELAGLPRDNANASSDIYLPLLEEDLVLGLAYEEEDEAFKDEDEQTQSSMPQSISDAIPSPPLPPPLAPPPPPIITPLMMTTNSHSSNSNAKSVKRMNWVKIEPVDLTNTVWGQLGKDPDSVNDVVTYLDLEEHFSMKKAKDLSQRNIEFKKDTICLLAHKKAYNTSILLAHLKLSHRQICDCLMICGNEHVRKRMDSSHYKQLLMYAPNEQEIEKLRGFDGDLSKLNEVDKLVIKLVNIPGYQLRLKALMFKLSFSEKEEEIQKNLEVVQHASVQLRKSRKLAKILEFVLAMGNYMNRGHNRIAKATGFRIHFLAEVDSTKTSDNKLTFLHILIRAVISKFPDVVSFPDEVTDVRAASRVVYPAVVEELQELRRMWLHIRDNLHETLPKTRHDKFKIAMETCLVRTNGSLKQLEQLQNSTVKEFNKAAKYFGENPKNIGMQQFFRIFDEFTRKFERSHRDVRKFVKIHSHPTK